MNKTKNKAVEAEVLANAPSVLSQFTAKQTKEILAAKREARKVGQLSAPFITAESLMTHLRQAKPR
jgi:hypothetical protein